MTTPIDPSGLPGEVTDLLLRHVESMEQTEVLLALSRKSGPVRAGEIARELRISENNVVAAMDHFVQCNLAVRDGSSAYRFAPSTPALAQAVTALDTAYNTRPVTLVKAIYARPSTAVQSFADAFRLRKPGA